MNRFLRSAVVIALVALFVFVLSRAPHSSAYSDTATPLVDTTKNDPQKSIVAGFDFSNIDRGASACQDFNQFASGGWGAKKPGPGGGSGWGGFLQPGGHKHELVSGNPLGVFGKK